MAKKKPKTKKAATTKPLELSWPLKRLLMAEIDNEEDGGTSPATLSSVMESLDSGYEPYDDFPVTSVRSELRRLGRQLGDDRLAKGYLTEADWNRRASLSKAGKR